MAATIASKLYIKGLGIFKIFGADSRRPVWTEDSVPAVAGEFAVERPIRLSKASAGITGSTRHAGTATPLGVADATNADTSREGVIGAGPGLSTITLTVSPDISTAATAPGTAADDATIGTNAWSNPDNAKVQDAVYATVAAAGVSHGLKLTNFGFAVPAGVQITGVQVGVTRSRLMASVTSGIASPGAGANFAAIGTNVWTNPANITASDDTYATNAIAGTSQGLRASSFGFSIPLTAQIRGIQLEIERHAALAGGISFVGKTNGTASASKNCVLNVPAGVVDGDVLIAQVAWSDLASTPAGWTSLITTQARAGEDFALYYRVAASEPANYTFQTSGVSASAIGVMSAYRGVDPVTPIDVAAAAGAAVTSGTTITAPTVTTVTNDAWLVSAFTCREVGTFSTPAAMTEREDVANGISVATSLDDERRAAAGATGTRGSTFSTTINFARAVSFALRPVASVADATVQLINDGGAAVGSNQASVANWPAVDAYATYGGAADLWGTTWTPAQVNAANFGGVLSASVAAGNTAFVDHMRITITYDDADVVDQQVRLVVGGVAVGANRADTTTQWPVLDTTKTYGSTFDGWAASLTAAIINAPTFGVELAITKGSGTGTARVDAVTITVWYSTATNHPATRIWSDGLDSSGQNSRYLYAVAGSAIHVIDPTTDTAVEVTSFGASVSGGDAAYWAGRWWVALRGGASDFVQEVQRAYNGVASIFASTDYTATCLAAGPNALYRSYVSGTNKALVQKTTEVTQFVQATVTLTASGAFSNGETITIGSKVYTLQNALTNVDGHVNMNGLTTAQILTNLQNAINRNAGTPGTDYAAAEVADTNVTAVATATTLVLTAIKGGVAANSTATTETCANASFSGATLTLGADTIAVVANWSPSSGEQMSDPNIGIVRLAAVGDRFLGGKEDGLAEFDQDFVARFYLDWMRAFRWTLQCQGILGLGVSGDMIVTFRRGLWILPRNISIGVEQIPNNGSDKAGRYTDVAWDGNWIYAGLLNPNSLNAHLIKMKLRSGQDVDGAPGIFAHHPILTRAASQFQALYVWPGCTVNGTTYGPRLYFAVSSNTIGYIRLGETQPDQLDANYRFDASWSVEWPQDDFGAPQTMKVPYRIECTAENAEGTGGMVWQFRADSDDTWQDFTADGTPDSESAIVYDSFHRRYGPRDGSALARRWSLRLVGSGGLSTAQQRVIGAPIFTIMEQPEQVREVTTKLQLEAGEHNDDDAAEQWRKLDAASHGQIVEVEAVYVDEESHDVARRFFAYLDVKRSAQVDSSGVAGVILADATIRAMNFNDDGDERDEESDAD